MKETPFDFYRSHIAEQDALLGTLRKKANAWLAGKIVLFLLGAWFVYQGFTAGWIHTGNLCVVAVLFVLYLIAAKCDALNMRRMEGGKRMKRTLENELKGLQGDYSPFAEGKEYIDPNHEYTYDLDIFGSSSFYQRLNRTVTKEGSDILAKWLRHYTLDVDVITRRRKAIRELSADGEALMRFIASSRQEDDRLRKFIQILKEREGQEYSRAHVDKFLGKKELAACVLLLVTWLSFGYALAGYCSWYVFSTLFFVQLLTGFLQTKKTGKMIGETEGLHKSFSAYKAVLAYVVGKEFHSPLMAERKEALCEGEDSATHSLNRLSHIISALYCRMNDVMFVVLNGLFLFDVFLLRSYELWKRQAFACMEKWVDEMADTDALLSMAVYAFNHPRNVDAVILDDDSTPYIMEAQNLYHPFLAEEHAVGNDLKLAEGGMMIVTGANMAGKSTFLRTVGINYVMAMNGLPVCADSLCVRRVSLFSSMRTADNLASHISYFHAELLRLEQLVAFCKRQAHTLIILDEILKGTNSEDKLKGSVLFLQKIRTLPVTGIVATHDLKLSELEAEDVHFQNYCFEIGLGKEISYSYKIKKGVARNLNATYLLNEILEKI